MKKIFLINLLLISILLSGCKTKQIDISDLKIVCPSGAPSLAFYSEVNNYNFSTADAAKILPEFKSENGSDFIVIDTVNGIKMLNSGSDYRLAATLTFGNFYIASTGLDDNNTMDEDDYIVLFSQGATPDLVFHYIYGDKYDKAIHYVTAVNDANACLIKGINISDDNHSVDEQPYVDYVMIAQPALTVALSQNKNASVYANIQELYSQKTNGKTMVQASLFVKNSLDKKHVDEFLRKLENNVDNLLNNPDLFLQTMQENNIGDDLIKDLFGVPNGNIVSKVLGNNSIGLGFKKAVDIKKDIDDFISIFGLENTNEEIYYK